ncbi:MerR family transcriptional regulator [Roseovarius tibetensis]|uniref:MerR family transcriptional regulator n=1 Tax=Roseovarius tibetensis TaxID=2685897 RepID=UPI003D7FB3DF
MAKSADAFRTISEVADILQVPAHVLRFWESKFPQIKPVKRAGGRRYYRPDDIKLIGGIRLLLHDEGMTIKGVQKILRDHGVAHVVAMAPSHDHAGSERDSGQGGDTATAGTTGADVLAFEPRGGTPPEPAPDTVSDAAPDLAMPEPPDAATPDMPDTAATEPDSAPPPGHAGTAPDAATAPPAPDTPPRPALPPLPDLPEDAPDTLPAPRGALALLAGLHPPVPADLATRLSAIADRLRRLDGDSRANDAAGN